MAIVKGWEFSRAMGYSGSADKGKTAVSAHERSVNCYAKGGKVEGKSSTPPPRPQKHFDRMENFRKERDAEPDAPSELKEKTGMAKGGKWIAGAIKKPGALHKELGVKKGDKIPAKKLAMAAKKGGKEGQRARLAETLKGMHKAKKFAKGGEVGGDRPIIDRGDSESVKKSLSKDSKLGIMGGTGSSNLVAMKKGGKAKAKGSKGGTAAKAAGALAQIAAAAQAGGAGGPPGGGMPPPAMLGAGPPPGGPMGPPPGMPPGAGGPPGMKRGGKTAPHKKK